MNLETRLRGRPRNRWQDEVREDGRIVDGEGWQEKVHNREEWKNGKESLHSEHATGMNERLVIITTTTSPTTDRKKPNIHTMIFNLVTTRNLGLTYAT